MKKRTIANSLFAAAIVGASLSTAIAQSSGYVLDTRGAVVKSGYGLCWRTGYWTPAMATAECDPELARGTPAASGVKSVHANEKMSLSADGLFDFGKSVLTAKGKASLNEFAAKLKGRKIEKIAVMGHTDRFGSAELNQKLSQKRADAVKAYLASKGVDKSKVVAQGKGSTQPKTAANQCEGKKSAKVIACLAPDRRVEIEASFAK